ncbi:hypothetical protein G6F37_009550 [Rhizopus arrhizus]|nr:hypothetical protein G6F38_008770 [Rhizopus arrhizus]KAG1154332.1 hypothetical protein G6F37_009550 [Rhizopus arrhizus]
MGQRQSSPQQQDEERQQQPQQQSNSRERVIRPSSRVQVERNNPIQIERNTPNVQYIPVNESQRREQRRQRRAERREQQLIREQQDQQEQQSEAPDTPAVTMTNVTNTSTGGNLSPFARMLAQVISEAVVASFRSGQIPLNTNHQSENNDDTTNRNTRQQLTMHLSPELFQQMEPDSDENSFMRFMRLPVIVSNVASNENNRQSTHINTDTNTDNNNNNNNSQEQSMTENNSGHIRFDNQTSISEDNHGSQPSSVTISNNSESEVTRILMLPVFLYGIRSNHHLNVNNILSENLMEEQPPRRQSQRIRERLQREEEAGNSNVATTESQEEGSREPQEQQAQQPSSGQWTVYIISGNSVENIMSEHNPTYEELLDLASIIGPARRPTVSQEAIDSHVPIVKYTQQVKQSIIGNAEGCQVCLNSYQSEEDVRILACHHGFHKECIDKWLTEGQNQCPLCRNVPVPTSSSS